MWTSSSLIRRSVKNTSGFFKHRAQSLEDPGEGLIKNNDLMFKNLKTVQTSLPVKAKSRLRDTSFEASFRQRYKYLADVLSLDPYNNLGICSKLPFQIIFGAKKFSYFF